MLELSSLYLCSAIALQFPPFHISPHSFFYPNASNPPLVSGIWFQLLIAYPLTSSTLLSKVILKTLFCSYFLFTASTCWDLSTQISKNIYLRTSSKVKPSQYIYQFSSFNPMIVHLQTPWLDFQLCLLHNFPPFFYSIKLPPKLNLFFLCLVATPPAQ